MKKVEKYLFLALIILLFQIIAPLNLDEIWNYGFVHNLVTGLVPYKNFNMVIPPFSLFLFYLPLKILGSNLLGMHITNTVLILFTFYLLEKEENKGYFMIFFFFLFWYCIFPGYNSLQLMMVIFLIELEKKEKRKEYGIGVLLACILLTKQSVGVCVLLASIPYYRKEKEVLKKRAIGFMIPMILFLLYLLFTNSFYEFLDLCVFGLLDFGTNNHSSLNSVHLLFIVFLIGNSYLIYKKKEKIEYWYLLAFLSIVIPIFDRGHLLYYLLLFGLTVLYPILTKKEKLKKINWKFITIFSIIVMFLLTCLKMNVINGIKNYPNSLNHFEYKYISKEREEVSKNIMNLYREYKSKNKNVILLSRSSYFYKLLLEEKITYYDLINKGNWGYHGSKKLEEKLKEEKDAVVLLQVSSFTRKDQTDTTAMDYVRKNCTKEKEIEDFEIYHC